MADYFSWADRDDIKPELNDCPIITNKSGNIKNSDFVNLHREISGLIIKFFKDRGLPECSERVTYSFDCLKLSVDFGCMTPMSDSHLCLHDVKGDDIILSM